MLGSTHGTLTTDFRARVVACGEQPPIAVHGIAAAEGDVDVSGRPLHAAVPDLDRFFRPESVAVVGASDAEGRPNTGITRQLMAWAERVGARLHPVHPTRETVFGMPCVPSVADLPEQVDLAVLLVGDPLPVIEQLADSKVKFAVAFASGFAETGEEGAAAQVRLAQAVEESGLRLLGPNTNLNAFERFRDDLEGPAVALITQSGHQGRPVFAMQELGVRLSHWAPTGNEADLETSDFISYFAGKPEVGAIACYVEGLKDGRSFLLATDRAARAGVPVVAVKVGRTETGARMAASHTGKLTGADDVVDAAMRQFGVVRVNGLDELQDTSALLARARKPVGGAEGVVVYSISGGTGAHFSDLASGAGLKLPVLSEAKQAELHEWIPPYLNVANPVDCGGHPVGDWRGRKIIDAILADPEVGVLICPITGPFPPMSDRLAQDLVDAAEQTDKLVCVVWGSPVGTEDAYRKVLLGSSRVATFRTFSNCITAVRAWTDHHRFTASYSSPFDEAPRVPSPSFRKAQALMRPHQQLS
ncbi:CoA-binding protein, partial [Streptomyces beijiangensis]